jgi:hypothetical protein
VLSVDSCPTQGESSLDCFLVSYVFLCSAHTHARARTHAPQDSAALIAVCTYFPHWFTFDSSMYLLLCVSWSFSTPPRKFRVSACKGARTTSFQILLRLFFLYWGHATNVTFSKALRPRQAPTQPPVQLVTKALFRVLIWTGRDRSLLSRAVVQNKWSCFSAPQSSSVVCKTTILRFGKTTEGSPKDRYLHMSVDWLRFPFQHTSLPHYLPVD